jgi:hypothetical protein
MSTANTNNNTPTLTEKMQGFFGLKKTSTAASSAEPSDNVHAQADADAHHSAAMMSDSTIPHPVPDSVLRDVESQKGKVPHANHIDVSKVEAAHQPQGLGHVMKDPTLVNKMGAAIKNTINPPKSTASTSTSTSTATVTSLPARDNIPHSALPNETLNEVTKAKGSVPHAKHIDIEKVEAAHQPGGLGHVVKDPTIMDKMSAAIKNTITPPMAKSTSSPATTATSAPANIPHSALPDTVLADVTKAKGSVPHAHHVDISSVEHKSAGLGHVQQEPTMMDKVKATLINKDRPLERRLSEKATLTCPHAHSSLPDTVLDNIIATQGEVPNANHVDIKQVEAVHEKRLSLGHVIDKPSSTINKVESTQTTQPILAKRESVVDRAKEAISNLADQITGTSAPVPPKDNIPDSALGPAVMKDVRQAHGQVPNAHHIQVIEHPSVKLGHVVEPSNK